MILHIVRGGGLGGGFAFMRKYLNEELEVSTRMGSIHYSQVGGGRLERAPSSVVHVSCSSDIDVI